MKAFIVKGTNRPGELANLTGALAAQDVNITIAAFGVNGQGAAGFVASDETNVHTILQDSGYEFESFPTLTVQLPNRPGQIAEIARLLGDQGVNILCFLPLPLPAPAQTTIPVNESTCMFSIGVDNIEAATKALGDQVVEYTYR